MLQQKLEEDQPAAQVRVSAKDLAEAVAAVESRNDLSGKHTDTISLGDAVDQLGLTVSAEELLAEIKAKQIQQEKLASERRVRSRKRLFTSLIALLVLSIFANIYLLSTWAPATPTLAGQVYMETGNFHTVQGQEGDVTFPEPYRRPPNVELTTSSNTIVTNTTTNGFHWKNPGGSAFDNVDVTWTARGLK